MKKTLLFLWVGLLLHSVGIAQTIWTKAYVVQQGDTLQTILLDRFGLRGSRYPLRGANGLISKMKKFNPHVLDWNNLQPGTYLYIELPYDTKANSPLSESGILKEAPVPSDVLLDDGELVDEPLDEEGLGEEVPADDVQIEDARIYVKHKQTQFDFEYYVIKEELSETTVLGSNVETKKKNFSGATLRYDYTINYTQSYTFSTELGLAKVIGSDVSFPLEYRLTERIFVNHWRFWGGLVPFGSITYDKSSHAYLDAAQLTRIADDSSFNLSGGLRYDFNFFGELSHLALEMGGTFGYSSSRDAGAEPAAMSGIKYQLWWHIPLFSKAFSRFTYRSFDYDNGNVAVESTYFSLSGGWSF